MEAPTRSFRNDRPIQHRNEVIDIGALNGRRCKLQRLTEASLRRSTMGFFVWIVVGLIAGWLAGQVMKGGGYGVLVDIILGILGGVVGGWVFGLLGI
jgi:hypothetical protein